MEHHDPFTKAECKFFNHISSIALCLEKATTDREIFQEIGSLLKSLYPDTYIVFTAVSPQKNVSRISVMTGLEKFRKRIESLLGNEFLQREFSLDDLSDPDQLINRNNKLTPVKGGLVGVSSKYIPKAVARSLEKLLNIQTVYMLGMVIDEHSLGNITIVTTKGIHFSPSDVHFIETLAVIGSIALQKIRALNQLRKDTEKIHQVFHTAPMGIGVVIDRVLQEVNDRVCEITGYSQHELIQQSARILYPSAEEFDRVGKEKYAKLKLTGTGQIETVWRCKDGTLRNILLRSSAINPKDLTEGVIFTALDITRRIETEQALTESEDRYRTLVENAPIAIMIHHKGIIKYINQTGLRLLEVQSKDQMIGKNALEIVHPDDRELAMSRITEMYRSGKPVPAAEERFISMTGKEIILQVAANIIQDQGSTYSMVFGLDVTGLKLAEKEIIRFSKELEEINNAKDKFFSIIAHDLKGPFNSILGFSDILNSEYDEYSDEERKHFIRNILSSSQNTYRLLENLLEWSRAQTNRIDYKPEAIEVSSVINETLMLVRSQAEAKDVHLFSAIEYDTRVMADENMVKTILRNLLSNAIKFSRRRGNVRIMEKQVKHSGTSQEMIEIIIKDDGVGMSKEILSQLFKIDSMIRTPGTDNEKGTGLGLILCRELVLRHGGEIWAASEPGKGCTVFFTLPKA